MDKTIRIGEVDVTFKRLSLKQWVELEEQKIEMSEAAEKEDFHSVVDAMVAYISAASDAKVDWHSQPWFDTILAFNESTLINLPSKSFPILRKTDEKKDEKLPWEYPGRTWYFWLNLLGRVYGWSKEYIGDLDIDDAIGLLQEISIDEQLQHEWEWMNNEIAYVYNKNSKTSEFKPLGRPKWMNKIVDKPKKISIKKSLLPVGNVIGLVENAAEDTKPS